MYVRYIFGFFRLCCWCCFCIFHLVKDLKLNSHLFTSTAFCIYIYVIYVLFKPWFTYFLSQFNWPSSIFSIFRFYYIYLCISRSQPPAEIRTVFQLFCSHILYGYRVCNPIAMLRWLWPLKIIIIMIIVYNKINWLPVECKASAILIEQGMVKKRSGPGCKFPPFASAHPSVKFMVWLVSFGREIPMYVQC